MPTPGNRTRSVSPVAELKRSHSQEEVRAASMTSEDFEMPEAPLAEDLALDEERPDYKQASWWARVFSAPLALVLAGIGSVVRPIAGTVVATATFLGNALRNSFGFGLGFLAELPVLARKTLGLIAGLVLETLSLAALAFLFMPLEFIFRKLLAGLLALVLEASTLLVLALANVVDVLVIRPILWLAANVLNVAWIVAAGLGAAAAWVFGLFEGGKDVANATFTKALNVLYPGKMAESFGKIFQFFTSNLDLVFSKTYKFLSGEQHVFPGIIMAKTANALGVVANPFKIAGKLYQLAASIYSDVAKKSLNGPFLFFKYVFAIIGGPKPLFSSDFFKIVNNSPVFGDEPWVKQRATREAFKTVTGHDLKPKNVANKTVSDFHKIRYGIDITLTGLVGFTLGIPVGIAAFLVYPVAGLVSTGGRAMLKGFMMGFTFPYRAALCLVEKGEISTNLFKLAKKEFHEVSSNKYRSLEEEEASVSSEQPSRAPSLSGAVSETEDASEISRTASVRSKHSNSLKHEEKHSSRSRSSFSSIHSSLAGSSSREPSPFPSSRRSSIETSRGAETRAPSPKRSPSKEVVSATRSRPRDRMFAQGDESPTPPRSRIGKFRAEEARKSEAAAATRGPRTS